MTTNRAFAAQEIDQTVRKNLAKLRKPGVLTVRPGFQITGDQLTGKQAILVTVHTNTHAAKQALPYLPPSGAPALDRRQLNTTITAAVSPDAGYATLSKFLAGTQRSLVIGMYDFTSGSLLKDFLADLAGQKTLQMVLDN